MAAVCPLPPHPTQPLTPCLVADTGALSSMIPHRSWFLTYEKCRIPIRLPHNKFIYAVGVGSVGFIPKLNGKQQEMVEFTRVLHVPELHNCLLSVLYLTKHRGVSVHIEGGVVRFIKAGELLFTATAAGDENIAYLDRNIAKSHSANLTSTIQTVPLSLDLWHQRLGHHAHTLVSAIKSRDLVTGMALSTSEKPDPICEPCLAGRMNANPFPPLDDKVFRLLEQVYSDVHQLHHKTHDGYQYWITFIDAHAKFFVVYLLKQKSAAFSAFKEYKAYAENITGQQMGQFHFDKGGEYMSNEFIGYLKQHGIVLRMTTRNCPQQNGVAEHANRTIEEHTTSMLEQAGLPDSFRGEAVAAYIHIWNMITSSTNMKKTPYEIWHKKKPNVSNLRIFGCNAFVHVQKDKRSGIHSHIQRCIFIGYPTGYAAWKFYNPVTKKVVISERAEFDERHFPALKQKVNLPVLPVVASPAISPIPDAQLDDVDDLEGVQELEHYKPPKHRVEDVPDVPDDNGDNDDAPGPDIDVPAPNPTPSHSPTPPEPEPARKRQKVRHITPTLASTRSRCTIHPPGSWWVLPAPVERQEVQNLPHEHDNANPEAEDGVPVVEFAGIAFQDEPESFRDAMKRSDATEWYDACSTEMNNHQRHGTWILVKAPPGIILVGGRWVMLRKRNSDGSIERYKARWVAKVKKKVHGIDYEEVFAPTYRMATIRLVCALAAQYGLTLYSLDITAAFLNGELEEDVYIQQPEGFEVGSL